HEPVPDVVEAFDPADRLAGAGELVALAGEAHELDLAAEPFERAEELLRLGDRAAMVLLAVDQQERRRDPLGVINGRAAHIALEALVGRAAPLPVVADPADVGDAPLADEVADRAVGHGGLETVGVTQ